MKFHYFSFQKSLFPLYIWLLVYFTAGLVISRKCHIMTKAHKNKAAAVWYAETVGKLKLKKG